MFFNVKLCFTPPRTHTYIHTPLRRQLSDKNKTNCLISSLAQDGWSQVHAAEGRV